MGRWLNRFQFAEKNTETLREVTDKTDKILADEVLSVLSVRQMAVCEKFRASASGSRCVSDDDRQTAFERRAAILEYDEGMPREEAERLMLAEVAALQTGQVVQFDPGPGVTFTVMPVEVPPAEYDHHLETLIAAAGGGGEANRLSFAKRKGWVVPRGDGLIYVRGR